MEFKKIILTTLFLLVSTEQPGMMSLLDHNESDARLVVRLQLDTGLSDGSQLVLENMAELSLTDTVPVHDDPVRLVAACALVEHHEMLPHHDGQVLDDVLSLLLHPHRGRVPAM